MEVRKGLLKHPSGLVFIYFSLHTCLKQRHSQQYPIPPAAWFMVDKVNTLQQTMLMKLCYCTWFDWLVESVYYICWKRNKLIFIFIGQTDYFKSGNKIATFLWNKGNTFKYILETPSLKPGTCQIKSAIKWLTLSNNFKRLTDYFVCKMFSGHPQIEYQFQY